MSVETNTNPDESSQTPTHQSVPPMESPATARLFDPVSAGAFDESATAELLAERVNQRGHVVFDATRDVWLRLGQDAQGQHVWQIVATNPLDYARVLVGSVAPVVPKGDSATDEGKARQRIKNRFSTSAGVGALAKLLLDVARRPGSVLYRRAEQIDAQDRPGELWAGGQKWFLDWRMQRDFGDEGMASGVFSDEQVHLRTAACAPDSTCPTPLWDELLDAFFQDDEEDRAYFLAVMGVCVTGTSDRVLPILYGPSGRGKTYVVNLVLSVLGSYGYTADASLLGESPDRASVAELEGRRLVFVDEAPRAGRLAMERLKALTGGGRQTTRALYAKPTSWTPRYTLVMTTNELPPVSDPAVRARLRPISFTDADPAEVKAIAAKIGNPATPSKAWLAEMPGVLAQLMVHAGRYLADRSVADVPAWVSDSLDEMEQEQNPVKAWLEDRTTEGEAKAGDLYEDFVAWSHRQGTRNPWGLPKWGQAMTEAGHVVRKTKHGNYRPRALKTFTAGPAWMVEGPRSSTALPPSTPTLPPSGGAQGPGAGRVEDHSSTSSTALPPAQGVASPLFTPRVEEVEEHSPIKATSGEEVGNRGNVEKIGNRSSTFHLFHPAAAGGAS